MCGRFAFFSPLDTVARKFRAEVAVETGPRYNVAPGQQVLAVVEDKTGGRELTAFRWGLIPFWAKEKDIRYRMINARAETVSEKPAFRNAFKKHRCIIPADGFFEWKEEERGGKQPYFIRFKSKEPMGFAGLWDHWEGEAIDSCSIIVTTANAFMADIHDRMPVILPETHYDAWLDPTNRQPQSLLPLLRPFPEGELEAYPVSRAVNNPRNEGKELLEEAR
jgi:putative SOS response-associated peptidase YedK